MGSGFAVLFGEGRSRSARRSILPVGFDAAHHALSPRFPKSAEGFARLFGPWSRFYAGVDAADESGRRPARSANCCAPASARRLVTRLARLDRRRSPAIPWRRRGGEIRDRREHRLLRRRSPPSGLAVLRHGAGGFLKAGGRFIKGGSRVLTMKLAKVVTKAGGSVLLGRDASAIEFDGSGHPAFVRHVDSRTKADEQRIAVKQVFANCAPHVLARMLPDAERAKIERAYGDMAALDLAVLGPFRPERPARRNSASTAINLGVLPDSDDAAERHAASARMFSADPGDRLPAYGIANYGAIDSGLAGWTGARFRRRRRPLRQLGRSCAAGRKGPARTLARRL